MSVETFAQARTLAHEALAASWPGPGEFVVGTAGLMDDEYALVIVGAREFVEGDARPIDDRVTLVRRADGEVRRYPHAEVAARIARMRQVVV